MQTVYKVCKLMYCVVVHICQMIVGSIHVCFNQLWSFLPMKCVHKFIDELRKISCNSYYVDNTATTGESKYFESGQQPQEVFNSNQKLRSAS